MVLPGVKRGYAFPVPAIRLLTGEDGCPRCSWAEPHADYRAYHDEEWGQPVLDDARLFEKLCLEGFQAGLSWLTILRKRENFRRAFRGFDFEAIARFDTRSVARLLRDPGIVRHRGKIEAVIHNARRARALRDKQGSLARYFWRFEPGPAQRPRQVTPRSLSRLTESAASRALARDLKQRDWRFVGPTTVYAFMQAMGLVNDHLEGCHARAGVERARARLKRP